MQVKNDKNTIGQYFVAFIGKKAQIRHFLLFFVAY